ncbi:MAG: chemotaxis-specific protein-glutamate methyltransferase CheB [Deltaproteobacteria bacterium]|nr:chemotaxis-specific protein-glutamate methyltransferase CheB [Deltaproteobacteria bacterium]
MKKVLIVDDSLTAREYLKYIIDNTPGLSVSGVATNGKEAVKLVKTCRPDIVAMDIQMPGMDGYETCRVIMENTPVPIVMVSATADPKEVATSFNSLEAGALALVEKPKGPGHPDADIMVDKLTRALRLMADIKVVRRCFNGVKLPEKTGSPEEKAIFFIKQPVKLVAVGASTGGPLVIKECLSGLPEVFPAPILVVQHITKGFLGGMISWLNQDMALTCKIAEHKEPALSGYVYFAPDGCHMEIDSEMNIVLCHDPVSNGICPSASRLFASVARAFGRYAAGILLTGMGKDGARELMEIRQKGGLTIAQDEKSCVVFGMPKEAIKLKAASFVLPPEKIGRYLSNIKGCYK